MPPHGFYTVDVSSDEVSARSLATWWNVNLNGTAKIIRHALPEMIGRKRGLIVNFSSGRGRSTDAEAAPYSASKWGIEGLTQALAQELPDGLAAELLQSCFGQSAGSYPSPQTWSKAAVPFLLKLGSSDNGKQLEVPLQD